MKKKTKRGSEDLYIFRFYDTVSKKYINKNATVGRKSNDVISSFAKIKRALDRLFYRTKEFEAIEVHAFKLQTQPDMIINSVTAKKFESFDKFLSIKRWKELADVNE